jgi:hypothetical protein
VSLRGADGTHRKTSGNQQMSDDAFHDVLLLGRRVSHESNLRNGCFTSIDKLLADESAVKVKARVCPRSKYPQSPVSYGLSTISLPRISKLPFKSPRSP